MTPTEPAKSSFLSLRVRPWGLITSAGIVAGAATLLGFLGSWSWAFDLCAHFRVQYFLGLTAVAILLLIPRQRKAAAIFGVLAVVNLFTIVPLYYRPLPLLARHPDPVERTGAPSRIRSLPRDC